ncbi:unnamed protein product [Musa textilis]
MEALLQGGVHAVLHGGSHRPGGLAGVERLLRPGHALLRGVHERRAGVGAGEEGGVARVQGDHAAGGGEPVHGGAVHLRLLVAAINRSGLPGWPRNVNGHSRRIPTHPPSSSALLFPQALIVFILRRV